jgi:hypothetical protein
MQQHPAADLAEALPFLQPAQQQKGSCRADSSTWAGKLRAAMKPCVHHATAAVAPAPALHSTAVRAAGSKGQASVLRGALAIPLQQQQ